MATVNVTFYICRDDGKKMYKNNKTAIKTLPCDWIEDTSMLRPSIRFSDMSVLQANYIYIAAPFNRFYFVGDPIAETGGFTRLDCNVDALSSWASYISGITTLIERQEHVWSPYIIDPELPTLTKRRISVKKVGNIGNPTGSYIALTATGGGGDT